MKKFLQKVKAFFCGDSENEAKIVKLLKTIGLWFKSLFTAVDGNEAKIPAICKKTARNVKAFFVSVDGNAPGIVTLAKKTGIWFKSLFVSVDGNEPKLVTLTKKPGFASVVSSIISILIGMAFGCILILLVAAFSDTITVKSAFNAVGLVFIGVFTKGINATNGLLATGFNSTYFGDMLFRATPLILTGLSVAVAFKTGLFNIGAPGQYLMGVVATLYIALSIPTTVVPAWFVWILAFLGAMVAGAIWGAIPGLFKSLLNINEVITCIMTNWIAAVLATWFFDMGNLKNSAEYGKVGYIRKTISNGVATPKLGLDKLFPGSQVDAGFLLAIIIAIIVFIIMSKTTFGYQLKACGFNRNSAKYAGINDKRNIVLSMSIAGALAGLAAGLYYLNGGTEFAWNTYQSLPAVGFNGIPVALLATNNPIAVIFTAIYMSMLNVNGLQIRDLTAYNEYITEIIIAVIVYLSAFSLIIKIWISKRKNKLGGRTVLQTLAGYEENEKDSHANVVEETVSSDNESLSSDTEEVK